MHDVYNMYIYNSVIHSFIFLLDLFVYLFNIYIYIVRIQQIEYQKWYGQQIESGFRMQGGNQEIEYGT